MGVLEEKDDGEHRDGANGQVDVEAPPPRNIRRKGTTNERADDGSNPDESTEQGLDERTFCEWHGVGNANQLCKTTSAGGKWVEEFNGGLTTPAEIPAAPTPMNDLPMMKAGELGAAPQRAEAASKNRMLASSTHLMEKTV